MGLVPQETDFAVEINGNESKISEKAGEAQKVQTTLAELRASSLRPKK